VVTLTKVEKLFFKKTQFFIAREDKLKYSIACFWNHTLGDTIQLQSKAHLLF